MRRPLSNGLLLALMGLLVGCLPKLDTDCVEGCVTCSEGICLDTDAGALVDAGDGSAPLDSGPLLDAEFQDAELQPPDAQQDAGITGAVCQRCGCADHLQFELSDARDLIGLSVSPGARPAAAALVSLPGQQSLVVARPDQNVQRVSIDAGLSQNTMAMAQVQRQTYIGILHGTPPRFSMFSFGDRSRIIEGGFLESGPPTFLIDGDQLLAFAPVLGDQTGLGLSLFSLNPLALVRSLRYGPGQAEMDVAPAVRWHRQETQIIWATREKLLLGQLLRDEWRLSTTDLPLPNGVVPRKLLFSGLDETSNAPQLLLANTLSFPRHTIYAMALTDEQPSGKWWAVSPADGPEMAMSSDALFLVADGTLTRIGLDVGAQGEVKVRDKAQLVRLPSQFVALSADERGLNMAWAEPLSNTERWRIHAATIDCR